jgi:hypothetical protein
MITFSIRHHDALKRIALIVVTATPPVPCLTMMPACSTEKPQRAHTTVHARLYQPTTMHYSSSYCVFQSKLFTTTIFELNYHDTELLLCESTLDRRHPSPHLEDAESDHQ